MTANMKTISIVLCTYNGEAYLEEQLQSLLGQTHPFAELIVQDDHSTDRTPQIVKRFQREHSDRLIRFYTNPMQMGYNRNFASAMQKAAGEYIAFCDQDDIWMPHKLEVLAREIGDAALIFHNSQLTDNQGRDLGLLHTRPLPALTPPLGAMLYPRAYGHQIMVRRRAVEGVKEFDDLEASYDYLTSALAGTCGAIAYTPEVLVKWRRHADAATYRPTRHEGGALGGYVRALQSLRQPLWREHTRLFFKRLQRLPIADAATRRAVQCMALGTLPALVRACFICLFHSRQAVPAGAVGLKRLARAFFTPLFFLRDHGSYIIRRTSGFIL